MGRDAEASRRAFEAFSRSDWQACLSEIDPDIEWHLTFQFPDLPPGKRVYRGHDEVEMLWRNLANGFPELTLEMEEVLYEAEGLLVVRARFVGRGGGSGIEVDRRIFYVQELRGQKLLRIRPFDTEAQAFEAAGVERG